MKIWRYDCFTNSTDKNSGIGSGSWVSNWRFLPGMGPSAWLGRKPRGLLPSGDVKHSDIEAMAQSK